MDTKRLAQDRATGSRATRISLADVDARDRLIDAARAARARTLTRLTRRLLRRP